MRDSDPWARIHQHVLKVGEEHPPLRVADVDFTVRHPETVRARYGRVLRYLARVELEVERNVLELLTLLPRVSETDRLFFEDVWAPQELQHGRILDQLQVQLGVAPEPVDVAVSGKIRLLGVLSHVPAIHDVTRMLYYLTGAATERSAVLAYGRLADGMHQLGERAIAETVVAPIRRQEPTHFAFYSMSARAMVTEPVLAPWQLWLTRLLRRPSFGPVGVNNPAQRADLGRVVLDLGLDSDLEDFAAQVGALERQVLWAHRQGLQVPTYVIDALRSAVEQAPSAEDPAPSSAPPSPPPSAPPPPPSLAGKDIKDMA